MNIKSQRDFFSGLMFMGVGVAFAWGATTYNVGEGARMGPGYFPHYHHPSDLPEHVDWECAGRCVEIARGTAEGFASRLA